MPIPQIDDIQFEGVKKQIKRAGRQIDDPPAPRGAKAALAALSEEQRRWCYRYVRSGGDIHEASKYAGYDTPGLQTANRMFAQPAIRLFITLIFESVQRQLEQAQAARRATRKADRAQEGQGAADRLQGGQPAPQAMVPEVLPPRVSAELGRHSAEIAELLDMAWRVARFKAGDLIQLIPGPTGKPTGLWGIDVEAVKNAPPGIVKSIKRDESGDMAVTIGDHADARNFLMNYYKTREGNVEGQQAQDVRTTIIALISGGDGNAYKQLQELSRNVTKELREAKAKTHGKVSLAKPEGDVPSP